MINKLNQNIKRVEMRDVNLITVCEKKEHYWFTYD